MIRILSSFTLFLSTLGPIGQKCPAPGTFGSLAGVLLLFLISSLTRLPYCEISPFFIPLIIIGIPICTQAEKMLNKTDPGEVIWDEFTTVPLVFWVLPNNLLFDFSLQSMFWPFVGLVLFRIFDIQKPFGIKRIQHFKSGLGIMIDDVLAAIYSAVILFLIFTFSLSFF